MNGGNYGKKHVKRAIESIEYWLMSDTHEGPTSGSDREDVYNSARVLVKELRTFKGYQKKEEK